jgi:hypothetical protein
MENFICSNCNYSLTIKKSSDAKLRIIEIDTPTKLVSNYENYKVNKDNNILLDIKFELSALDKHLSKNNVKEEERELIRKFYNNFKKNISKYNLVCSTCGHEYILKPETTIYSLNFKNQHSTFNDEIEELVELKFNDPTLPRTKDYICPYASCESKQKNFDTSKKEAIMYRANRTYHMKYACLVCKGPAWHI